MNLFRTLIFVSVLFGAAPAEAQTSGEVYNRCLYRYPGAAAACDKTIQAAYQELKFSGLKCDAADRAGTKEITIAVIEYLRVHTEVHKEPTAVVLRNVIRLVFRCE